MALIVRTSTPQLLMARFKKDINSRNIRTWVIDSDGDITIFNSKWNKHAWFKIIEDNESGQVQFGIIPSKVYNMTTDLYGIYHGRLAATLLANFDDLFDAIQITSGYLDGIDILPLSLR